MARPYSLDLRERVVAAVEKVECRGMLLRHISASASAQ